MFIDKEQFSFVATLEANWREIRAECERLLERDFDPWVQGSMYETGWTVYGLVALGQRVPDHAERCPFTTGLIEQMPGVTLAGFSRMAPGTHIRPHIGWAKSVYRLHLGLIVPEDCALKVNDETRHFAEGECLVFDDTRMHEAWNRSERTRINLLLDFLRPGITDATLDTLPEEVIEYSQTLLNR